MPCFSIQTDATRDSPEDITEYPVSRALGNRLKACAIRVSQRSLAMKTNMPLQRYTYQFGAL